jgi:hypothetical protein
VSVHPHVESAYPTTNTTLKMSISSSKRLKRDFSDVEKSDNEDSQNSDNTDHTDEEDETEEVLTEANASYLLHAIGDAESGEMELAKEDLYHILEKIQPSVPLDTNYLEDSSMQIILEEGHLSLIRHVLTAIKKRRLDFSKRDLANFLFKIDPEN